MTTIYSTPLDEQLKEAQRTASRLETENAALKRQLAEREAWEPVPDDVREAIGAALNLAFANCGKYDHAEKEQITLASAWLEQAPQPQVTPD